MLFKAGLLSLLGQGGHSSWGGDLILGLLRVKCHRQPKNRLSVANTDRHFLGCLKHVQAA